MWVCPICGRKNIGRVAADQYYCWDCFLEFTQQGLQVKVFEVGEDGSLMDYSAESVPASGYEVDVAGVPINTSA